MSNFHAILWHLKSHSHFFKLNDEICILLLREMLYCFWYKSKRPRKATPMNKTRPRNWLAKLFYTSICLMFLGALYFVVEAFFPKTSPELIPRDDALSAKFMSNPQWGNTYQRDVRERALSGPVKEKNFIIAQPGKKIRKIKNCLPRIGGKFGVQNRCCYSRAWSKCLLPLSYSYRRC